MVYLYPIALAAISAFVAVLEAVSPWRKEQRQLRPALISDLFHLVFNGHFLGVVLFAVSARFVLPYFDRAFPFVHRAVAADWPLWVQIPVALLAIDFVHWCVHNLLHRIPLLWELHKTHHSVVDGEMDWIVSFRFQWTEVVVYKSVQYVPLAFFGFSGEAAMVHAIFGTLIGHLNHSNLDLSYGPLRYLLNSPRMHIWHHDFEGDAKTTVNFGIIFSCWDWIFGTAKMPAGAEAPARLGFPGVELFPTDFFSQTAWPLPAWLRFAPRAVSQLAGAVLLSLGLWCAYGAGEPADPVAAFGEEARAAGFAHPEHLVSAGELALALGAPELIVLDARSREKFEEAHIPRAQNVIGAEIAQDAPIPGLARSAAELEKVLRARGVRAGSVVVVYGDGGPEPYRLWWTLSAVGGFSTRVLDGGLQAWRALGRKAESGAPAAVTAGDVVLVGAPVKLRWSELMPGGQLSEGTVLLDVRTLDEFTGKTKHAEAQKPGHIPGAKHLHWIELLDSPANPRLKSPAALRALFAARGVDLVAPPARVITSCQSGSRAAVAYFALHQLGLGDDRAAAYNGSWAEYSRLELPVALGE